MKHLFTLLFSFTACTLVGQTIEIQPSNTMSYAYQADEFTLDPIDVLNISDDAVVLEYEVLSNSFLEEWSCTLCAGVNCDPFIPVTGDLGTVQPEETTFFSFGMNFNGEAGEGTIEIRVFDPNNSEISEIFTLTYIVSESTTNVNELTNEYQIKVGPNPVQESVIIQSDLIQDYEVAVYGITGQLVFIQNFSGNVNELTMTNQNAGLYTLVVRKNGEVVFIERLLKQ